MPEPTNARQFRTAIANSPTLQITQRLTPANQPHTSRVHLSAEALPYVERLGPTATWLGLYLVNELTQYPPRTVLLMDKSALARRVGIGGGRPRNNDTRPVPLGANAPIHRALARLIYQDRYATWDPDAALLRLATRWPNALTRSPGPVVLNRAVPANPNGNDAA